MITGEFTFAAASSVALMVFVPMVFTAGKANWLSFASLYKASQAAPNKTPEPYLLIDCFFTNV